MRATRYTSLASGKGAAFEKGELKLEDLRELAIANGEPKQISANRSCTKPFCLIHYRHWMI